MKLTESKLRHIIREEIQLLAERTDPSDLFRDDLEGLIKEYYYRELSNQLDDPYFFEQLFERLEPAFRRKSVEHGFLGKEPLKDYYRQLAMGPRNVPPELGRRPSVRDVPGEFTIGNAWITITEGDVVRKIKEEIEENGGRPLTEEQVFDAIVELHVNRFQDRFGDGVHRDIYEIYKDLRNHERLSKKEKIRLAERAIHAEHKTGTVLDIYPGPEELRDEAEEEYEKRQGKSGSKVARMRSDPRMI